MITISWTSGINLEDIDFWLKLLEALQCIGIDTSDKKSNTKAIETKNTEKKIE